jgi:hypothetical protein
MDLITGLSAHKGQDTILTIVDHGCSRAAIFLLCATTITGPGIAQLYMDHVYRWFGLPTKIISDWDSHFTFHFSKALSQKLEIQQNLSSVPSSNGWHLRKEESMDRTIPLIGNFRGTRRLNPLASPGNGSAQQ